MKTQFEQVTPIQYRMSIAVPSDVVNASFDKIYKKIRKDAKVNGFRQGKAPIDMIKRLYGSNVKSDVSQELIQEHLYTAIQDEMSKNKDLRIVGYPSIEELKPANSDEDFEFSALVETFPKITIENYKGLSLSSESTEVTTEEVDNELKHLQKTHAKTKTLAEDAVATTGNLVQYSARVMSNGQIDQEKTQENLYIELSGDHQHDKELAENIKGLKVHEEKTFTITEKQHCDHDHGHDHGNAQGGHEHEVSFEYNIKILSIMEVVEPELDDDFAKDLDHESLEKMRSALKEKAQENKKQLASQKLQKQALDKIIKAHKFDVPNALIESCTDEMIAKVPWPSQKEYDRARKDPSLRERVKEPATEKAKEMTVLWQIADQEGIKVSDDELRKTAEELAPAYKMSAEDVVQRLGDRIREDLLGQKVLDLIMSSAIVAELPIKEAK